MFRDDSDVPRHGRIPSCNAILKWVGNFNVCVNVVNKSLGLYVPLTHHRTMKGSNAAESNILGKAAWGCLINAELLSKNSV